MRAVLTKDKQAWLNLFADDAVVEDPIGVSPLDPTGKGHRGKAAISAFWNADIGPRKTEFDIRHSYAAGNEVANVGQSITTMPDGKKAFVRVVITYKVNDEGKTSYPTRLLGIRKDLRPAHGGCQVAAGAPATKAIVSMNCVDRRTYFGWCRPLCLHQIRRTQRPTATVC
jgi:ketosteroid isomerase-like protein